jgi:16S rRNA (guanine966-N2)-methyltransferase
MRIAAGHLRGRRLEAPAGHAVRPTSERARAAAFDVLLHRAAGDGGARLTGAAVLDAFAGTGALGLEALSRGAAHAVFLDRDAALTRTLNRRAADWGLSGRVRVLTGDALRPPRRPADLAPRTLVFLDPPYGRDLAGPALAALEQAGWLAPDVLVLIESGKDEPLEPPAGFVVWDDRRQGRNRLRWLERRPDSS